jgi:hypothetical protein
LIIETKETKEEGGQVMSQIFRTVKEIWNLHVGWFVTWLGFRKDNPAADCNFKLSFQPT